MALLGIIRILLLNDWQWNDGREVERRRCCTGNGGNPARRRSGEPAQLRDLSHFKAISFVTLNVQPTGTLCEQHTAVPYSPDATHAQPMTHSRLDPHLFPSRSPDQRLEQLRYTVQPLIYAVELRV